MNKKGSLEGSIYIVGGLFILLFIGFAFAMGTSIIQWISSVITPDLTSIGQDIGGWNGTQTMTMVVTPVNNIINGFTWLGGVMYVIGLVGIFGLAFAFRTTNQRWLVPLFFCLMLLLVIASIFMSNMYQDFYTGTDEIATRMQAQNLLSDLILNSPVILTIAGFIAGAIMFSGAGVNE